MYIHVHRMLLKVNTLLLEEIKMMSVVCYMILDYGTVRYYSLVSKDQLPMINISTHFLSLRKFALYIYLLIVFVLVLCSFIHVCTFGVQ